MDDQGLVVERIVTSTDPDGRWSIYVETVEDADKLSQLFGMNILVGDVVEGLFTVTDR